MASVQFRLKGLREKRAAALARIQKIGAKIKAENRGMSTEERSEFDRLQAEVVTTGAEIEDASHEIDARGAGADDLIGREDRIGGRRAERDDRGQDERDAEERALAFQAWARFQHGSGLTPAHERAVKRAGIDPRAKEFRLILPRVQQRAMSATTGAAGAYTIAEGFGPNLDRALKAYGGVRQVARVLRSPTGAPMPWPTTDDTANIGERIGENTEVAYNDPTIGVVTFGGYKYSSKGVLIPYELLEDNAVNLESELGSMLGERLGRVEGVDHTTGTGTSQPQGVVTGASAGITAAGATAITGAEVLRLSRALDPAYRAAGPCYYMAHDGVLAVLALLVDSEGRPLFAPSWREGMDMLCGYPAVTNQHMQSTLATGTTTLLFGNFERGYVIRDVGEVRIRRLDERWAEKDQVGFIGFMRSDARYINTAAVKKLVQA